MAEIERQSAVLSIIQHLRDLNGLKKLFWEELNYESENKPLSIRGWPDSDRNALADDPVVFATGGEDNAFRVIYCKFASDTPFRGLQRPVVNRLIKDHPYALFIFSNRLQTHWHFLNVKYDSNAEKRRLFRRITVRPGDGLRTASERLHLLDLKPDNQHDFTNAPPLQIQAFCDEAFNVEQVTRAFYKDLANWYFWALKHIRFPKDAPKEADGQDHSSAIRLITRLVFCWFIKEKGLIPEVLFNGKHLTNLVNGFAPENEKDKTSVFYRAILQNLFFATLNTEMDRRDWAKEDQNFMVHSLYRYKECFQKPSEALTIFKNIPFLNGGLFECLDKDLGEEKKPRYKRIDGFSRRPDSQPVVPDFLFFGGDREVDLSEDYGDKKYKKIRVRGLIETFKRYHFTIEENTPLDQDVALDPELAGRIFENLLAAYNPETGDTVRKQTGSFYTPREIVNYMVDEAMISFLKDGKDEAYEKKLRRLLSWEETTHDFSEAEVNALIGQIDALKALDPAVGSGAFPMGLLHKLVFVLGKLDSDNERWKAKQIAKLDDPVMREEAERLFKQNYDNYGRKLFLIENCIYGVDIQPIAVQIAKMRFFISLIVDQKVDDALPNRGVRALPNLETKFVAANTLIGIEKPQQMALRNPAIDTKEAELRLVREKHFNAKTPSTKEKYREHDKKLRVEIADLLKSDGWDDTTAKKLAHWDPYDQNASADFFDPEWMFGVREGFDVVLGNPPYIDSERMTEKAGQLRELIQASYSMTKGNWDIYIAFYEQGFRLMSKQGVLSFITPDKWISKPFGDEMRVRTVESIFSILKAGRSVFESSNVDAIVSVFLKKPQSVLNIYELIGTEIRLKRVISKNTLKPPYAYDWLFSDFVDLLLNIEARCERLSEHGICENACATSDAYKLQEFIVEEPGECEPNEFLRIVNTGTIGKYLCKWGQRKMVYLGHKYVRPVVHKERFLGAFRNSYGKKAIRPKLILKGLNLLDACLDADGIIIPGKTTLMITSNHLATLKFLLALVNSTVAFFYLKEKYPASSYNQGITFTKEMINDLPLPKIAADDRAKLVSIVDCILAAKQADLAADTSVWEREIDELVYGFYGLTKKEICHPMTS